MRGEPGGGGGQSHTISCDKQSLGSFIKADHKGGGDKAEE